jgi:hypothetical protein
MAYINTGITEIRRDVLYLYRHAASSGAVRLPPTQTTNMQVVPAGKTELIIPHALLTASVVPAFMPSWNTTVTPTWITTEILRVRFNTKAPDRGAVLDSVISRGTRLSVDTEATSHTITHNLAGDIGTSTILQEEDGSRLLLEDGGALQAEAGIAFSLIVVSASWNTTIYRTARSINAMTVDFNTPAPAGAYLYWSRHNEDSDITGTDQVTELARTHTIEHNAGWAFLPMFVLPNWNTQIRFVNKSNPNQTVIGFNTPAPDGAELDWRVKFLASGTRIS